MTGLLHKERKEKRLTPSMWQKKGSRHTCSSEDSIWGCTSLQHTCSQTYTWTLPPPAAPLPPPTYIIHKEHRKTRTCACEVMPGIHGTYFVWGGGGVEEKKERERKIHALIFLKTIQCAVFPEFICGQGVRGQTICLLISALMHCVLW